MGSRIAPQDAQKLAERVDLSTAGWDPSGPRGDNCRFRRGLRDARQPHSESLHRALGLAIAPEGWLLAATLFLWAGHGRDLPATVLRQPERLNKRLDHAIGPRDQMGITHSSIRKRCSSENPPRNVALLESKHRFSRQKRHVDHDRPGRPVGVVKDRDAPRLGERRARAIPDSA
jgi:hypothetical protein